MRNAILAVSIVLGFVFLTGCGPKPGDCNLTTVPCSCDRRTAAEDPDCRDYEATTVASATSSCTRDGGTFSASALCPTASRAGTCKATFGSSQTHYRYYLQNYGTASSGALACGYIKANCFMIGGGMLCDTSWLSDI
jgi:hypothetical protein